MQTTITIEGIGFYKLDIATYTQFQQEMFRLVTEFGGDQYQTFRMSKEFTESWEKKINTLLDANRVVRATANTEKLAELDQTRDKAITLLFNGIRYALDSFDVDEVEAAKRLNIVRKKYVGIQQLNYDRQTASTAGLLQDLSSAELQRDIAALNLSAKEQKIREINTEFRRLYGEVSNARAASKLPTLTELKADLSPIWEEVVQRIQAGYIFAANDSERENIYVLVQNINQRIKQIKDNFNRSQGAKKAGKKPTDDDSQEEQDIVTENTGAEL